MTASQEKNFARLAHESGGRSRVSSVVVLAEGDFEDGSDSRSVGSCSLNILSSSQLMHSG